MPRTSVDDPRRFDRFQGIDVRDDAESNTLSDAVNITVDEAGRLTRPKYPSRLSDGGTEAVPATPPVKSAASMYDSNGNEVSASINTIEDPALAAPPKNITVDVSGIVTIRGTNLLYVEKVLLMKVTEDQCFMSGLDFTVTASAASIVCTATSTWLVKGDKAVIWMPTCILAGTIDNP